MGDPPAAEGRGKAKKPRLNGESVGSRTAAGWGGWWVRRGLWRGSLGKRGRCWEALGTRHLVASPSEPALRNKASPPGSPHHGALRLRELFP